MDKDDLIAEMTKWASIARAPDPILELDIVKMLKAAGAAGERVTPELLAALENILRHPETMDWKIVDLPAEPLKWEPDAGQVEWFRKFIATGVKVWLAPTTGQRYKIDHASKTFILTRQTQNDPDRWHERNAKILGMIGWRMIDKRSTACGILGEKDGWRATVSNFSIEEQLNPATGENHPPGSRGCDGAIFGGACLLCLGHNISHHFWQRFIAKEAKTPEYGAGKTIVKTKV